MGNFAQLFIWLSPEVFWLAVQCSSLSCLLLNEFMRTSIHRSLVWGLMLLSICKGLAPRRLLPQSLRRSFTVASSTTSGSDILIQALSFYKFINIDDPESLVNKLKSSVPWEELNVKGTLLVSREGVNGAVACPDTNVETLRNSLIQADISTFEGIDFNIGQRLNYNNGSETMPFPFKKLVVRKKKSILTDGLGDESMSMNWNDCGEDVDAKKWHEYLEYMSNSGSSSSSSSSSSGSSASKNYLLLDCRNGYESEMGTFEGAIPLNTEKFSDTFPVLDKILQDTPKDSKILTFCTGGIRCNKVNAYLKQKLGFHDIGKLKNGIISYENWISNENEGKFEVNQAKKSFFRGKNFLFDRRRLKDNQPSSS